MKKTDILEVFSRKLAPFILLFGCYLIAFGHLSPGGGFQGGVVLASGIILLALCHGVTPLQGIFPKHVISCIEALGFLGFLMIGLAGMILGGHFLMNFLPVSHVTQAPNTGFIFLLNLVIGLKVGAGMVVMCFYLFGEEES